MSKFIIFLLIGIVLVIIGITNIKGDISSVHWYNRTKVSEADIPKYGRCIGTGTLIIGASMILSALLEAVVKTDVSDCIVYAGCAAGAAVILYGQFKYNKGIF